MSRAKHAPRPADLQAVPATKLSDLVWLSVTEAAKKLGVSRARTYELVASAELESIQHGKGHIRVSERSIEDYLRRGYRPAKSR